MPYRINTYHYLRTNKELLEKYEHAGIYSISIDDKLVYIGKSHNMLKRIAQHIVEINREKGKKYIILAENKRLGHSINFDVIYYATNSEYDAITEEIGEKEGELIREFMPMLNTHIPDKDNWKKYTRREIDNI